MSLITEDYKPSVSTLEEVKKLQDLVRKLEIQNKHLKNKQNIASKKQSPSKDTKSPFEIISPSSKKESPKILSEVSNCDDRCDPSEKDEYFEDLDIITVSDIDMSDDEETWLYTSPKGMTHEQKNESPYKWLRKDVDDPENKQLQLTKKALLTKLNELEILSPNQAHSTPHYAGNPTVNNLRRPQVSYKQISIHSEIGHIDTRTFTKSKKKQALEFLETLDMLESERNFEKVCVVQGLPRRGSDISLDSVSSNHVLEDANDVQEVARMQEESLRLSSPIGTPKRASQNSLSRKASISSKSSVSDLDVGECPVVNSRPIEDVSGVGIASNKTTPLYPNEYFNNSDQSSPSESPYSSNNSLNNEGKGKPVKLTGYRRSLPNLTRDATFTRQSKTKASTGAKLQMPSSTKGVSRGRKIETNFQTPQRATREICSPTRLKFSQASSSSGSSYSEPLKNSLHKNVVSRSAGTESRLRPRLGLPKPSRASSATRVRSGIPMPSSLSKKQEDSWSEGCF